VAVGLLAIAVLIGLYIATGGSLPSLGLGSSTGATPAPPAVGSPTSSGSIKGTLTVSATKLKGSLWRFAYTIHNTGTVPIAGLQLSGAPTNLTAISSRTQWNFYGAGVCHNSAPGILIYWSTGSSSPTVVKPGGRITLSFQTRTTGSVTDQYALSWAGASPRFGTIKAPAPSTLPVHQHCPK
jgi:hypothetical protein